MMPLYQKRYDAGLGRDIAVMSHEGSECRILQFLGCRYRVDGLLAAGGQGVIFIACDERVFGKRVLIKVNRYDGQAFRNPRDADASRQIKEGRERLKRERDMLLHAADRGIPGVPTAIDWVIAPSPQIRGPHRMENGTTFELDESKYGAEGHLVMSYVSGVPLSQACLDPRFRNKLLGNAKQVILQVGRILNEFHRPVANGDRPIRFVYQDLKPDNVIWTSEGTVVLVDFGGFATVCGNQVWNARVTTQYYGAPEMFDGTLPQDAVKPVADVFSLGATVLHVLRGSAPIDANGEGDYRTERLEVPGEWKVWLSRALERKPEERFRSLTAAIDAAHHLPLRMERP